MVAPIGKQGRKLPEKVENLQSSFVYERIRKIISGRRVCFRNIGNISRFKNV